MKEQFLQAVAHEEAILAIIVQLIGMFLILSSTVMFVKEENLHRLENVLQLNILFCSTVFLLIDWVLVLPGTWPCEMFSLVFIFFGSANTFSTLGIALGRYKKMMRLSLPFSERIWHLMEVVVIWLASLLLVVYPASEKITLISESQLSQTADFPAQMQNSTGQRTNLVCFFRNSLLYRNSVTSGSFLLTAVALPFCLMLFFYLKIFKRVREARLNAWLNRIAQQRSRQTQVIQCGGRKANVFQLTSNQFHDQNARRFNQLSYKREKSVLLKGIFSAAIVLLCWLPYTAVWLYLSMEGFRFDYLTCIRYLMINSKISVILNVLHYICLNVKYRYLYIHTVFGQFTNLLQTLITETEEHTSQTESHLTTCPRPSVLEKPISATKTSRTVLEPIQENQCKECEQQQRLKTEKKTQKRQRQPTIRRALSLPHNLMPSSVHPENSCEKQTRSESFLC